MKVERSVNRLTGRSPSDSDELVSFFRPGELSAQKVTASRPRVAVQAP